MCVICIANETNNFTNLEKDLDVISCPTLEYIPRIKNVRYLSLENCHSIKTISDNKYIKILTIKNCGSLMSISNLKNMKEIYVKNCNSLLFINGNSNLGQISMFNCYKILYFEYPNGPMHIKNCTSLNQPNIFIRNTSIIQRFWRRQIRYKIHTKIIDQIVEIYYQPGMKGTRLSQKRFENSI